MNFSLFLPLIGLFCVYRKSKNWSDNGLKSMFFGVFVDFKLKLSIEKLSIYVLFSLLSFIDFQSL